MPLYKCKRVSLENKLKTIKKKRSMTHKVSNRHPAKKRLVFFAQDSNSKCISAAIEHSWSKRPKTSKVGRWNVHLRLSSTKFPPMSYVWQRSRKDCAERASELKNERLVFLKVHATRKKKKGAGNGSAGRHLGDRGSGGEGDPQLANTRLDSRCSAPGSSYQPRKHYGQSSYQ